MSDSVNIRSTICFAEMNVCMEWDAAGVLVGVVGKGPKLYG